MTDLRTAAQQALDFIRWSQFVPCRSEPFPEPPSTAPQVEAALRAALAKPEPVAWLWEHQLNDLKHYGYRPDMRAWTTEKRLGSFEGLVPLYTAPPQRLPLTEGEIEKAYREIWRDLPSDFDHTSSGWIEQGIKYAERAHGIT